MGEVWKARDTRLNRIVAVKRLAGKHTARFEQEARAIAALNHPNICQIFDIGDDYLLNVRVEFTNIFNRMELPAINLGTLASAPTTFTSGPSAGLYSGGYGTIVPEAGTSGQRAGSLVGRFQFQ